MITPFLNQVPSKSFLGRIFGIIWVLVGAVMMSMFTGLIISAMQASLDGTKCKDIAGKEVRIKKKKFHLKCCQKGDGSGL